MDERQPVCYPRSGTCSPGGSVCCVLLILSSFYLISSPNPLITTKIEGVALFKWVAHMCREENVRVTFVYKVAFALPTRSRRFYRDSWQKIGNLFGITSAQAKRAVQSTLEFSRSSLTRAAFGFTIVT